MRHRPGNGQFRRIYRVVSRRRKRVESHRRLPPLQIASKPLINMTTRSPQSYMIWIAKMLRDGVHYSTFLACPVAGIGHAKPSAASDERVCGTAVCTAEMGPPSLFKLMAQCTGCIHMHYTHWRHTSSLDRPKTASSFASVFAPRAGRAQHQCKRSHKHNAAGTSSPRAPAQSWHYIERPRCYDFERQLHSVT